MTTPRRWVLLCTIGGAVLAIHAALLLLWGPAWFDTDSPAAAAPARARSVTLAPMQPPLPVAMPSAQAPAPPSAMVPRKAAIAASAPPATVPSPTPVAVAPANAGPATEAMAGEPTIDVPVYATRLPPAGHWRYRLQRGLAVGEADLQWAPTAEGRYALRLEGRVAGVTVLDWASQGQLDVAGIAPERFAVRRRGRDREAANFQRGAGKITFSGPSHELPLLPGSQDRLSWMLQLSAVVAAAPERFDSGAAVVLFVAGARGGADVWTFVVQGIEQLGDAPALKLVREPRRLYDTRAEVWLDPAAQYLPLRVLQTPSGGGAPLELLREQEQERR